VGMRLASIAACSSSLLLSDILVPLLLPILGGSFLLARSSLNQKMNARKKMVITFPIGCSKKSRVSAKAILRFSPCAFMNDFESDSMNSAPSSKASGGHIYAKFQFTWKTDRY